MKVKRIELTKEGFAETQRNNLKYFLQLCKYDVIPTMITGSTISAFTVTAYSSSGVIDSALFGGIAGTALILAINGVVTGVKATKEERKRIKEGIAEKDEKVGNDGRVIK